MSYIQMDMSHVAPVRRSRLRMQDHLLLLDLRSAEPERSIVIGLRSPTTFSEALRSEHVRVT